MEKFTQHLNRRHLIRGGLSTVASASIVNSFSLQALAANRRADIKRLIIWYVPGGAAQQAFWPEQTGKIIINEDASIDGKNPQSTGRSIRAYVDPSMAGYCLQPLHKHVDNISLYSGFQNRGGTAADPHLKVVQTALTGGEYDHNLSGSLDQIMAPRLRGSSPFPSIYLPVYGHHTLNKGANDAYLSPARRSNGRPFGSPNWNPVETYNALFPVGISPPNSDYDEVSSTRLSILKSAEKRLKQVKCEGGEVARLKLEAMLQSYQQLEQDTQALIDARSDDVDLRVDLPDGWTDTRGTRTDLTKYWNQETNFGKLVNIAIDTTVAAFALDKTRVSLMQFSSSGVSNKGPVSGNHYKTLGIQGIESERTNDNHLAHNANAALRRDQTRVFRWYYGRLAYLIGRLKSIPDGNGTLFDTTLIMTASDFGMYNDRNIDMPYIVAAGSNINIRKGVYQDVREDNNQNNGFRHTADFLLGVGQALDPSISQVGQSGAAFTL